MPESETTSTAPQPRPAGLHLRLTALAYDSLLVMTVMIVAAAVVTAAGSRYYQYEKVSVARCVNPSVIHRALPQHGQEHNLQTPVCLATVLALEVDTKVDYTNPFVRLYIISVYILFIAWFWTHGGQTLGMRSWRIRVETLDGKNPGWILACVRVAVATLTVMPFGIGMLWMLVDPTRQTLYDRICRTRVVRVEKDYVPDL